MAAATLVAVKSNSQVSNIEIADSHNSLTAQFAKWFYIQTMDKDKMPNGKIISISMVGRKIQSLKGDGSEVKESTCRQWVSAARIYTEKHLACTIWPVPGRGWRSSTKVETAKYYGKCIRKTIAWADRTRNLAAIVERKYIPYTIREVVGKAEGGIKSLSATRKRFLEMYGMYEKQEKEHIGEKKQLAIAG